MAAKAEDTNSLTPVYLELRNISKGFGGQKVLRNLSLGIKKGELCCLLGPSGCGKTTLLRIIDGLLPPDGGHLYLMGNDITPLPPQKRNIGLVFQNYALFPHMNVSDNIAYGLHRRKITFKAIKSRVDGALKLVQLEGYGDRRIHELSGGQQQRVALARSLVIEPELLLLDEPLSNLDARLRADVRDEIRRIQQSLGITTIYVTHDQEEAMGISDRIVVMNRGKIEQVGSPREIYEKPASRFVADFIGRMNFIPGKVIGTKLMLFGRIFDLPYGNWRDGIEVVCAIRPEKLRLEKNDGGQVTGTVTDVVYLGATVRYYLATDGSDGTGQRLLVEVPAEQAIALSGEKVSIRLESKDLHLLGAT
ncbi:MAG: ABC transporter ATP-binding protein [Chloroflexota bacterium]